MKLSKQTIVVTVGLLFLFVISAMASWLWSSYQSVTVTPNLPVNSPQVVASPSPDPLRPRTFLIMGYGGGAHEGGKLTDTMMVAYVDPKLKKVSLISLPRDLWVTLPVEGETLSNWKINAAYAIGSDDRRYTHKPVQYTGEAGGGELAKHAVEQVLGFPIDHFVAVSFRGFTKAIDTLGGVTVKVERSFDDFNYPIEGKEEDTCGKSEEEIAVTLATQSAEQAEKSFSCRFELLHFDRGAVKMDGETALKYVRSRHSPTDGGDFNRAARQRTLITAVKEKIFSLHFLSKAIPFVTSLTNDLQTDLDLSQMQEVIGKAEEWRTYSINNVALTNKNVLTEARSQNGQFIMVAREGEGQWSGVHRWLQEQLQAASPSASTTSP